MKLPLGISVPHAGLTIPDALVDRCRLTPAQIEADGDVGARRIYDFAERVTRYATTDVARAVLDLNRPRDDFRKDGVVKTHTCWDEPVWPEPLTGEIVAGLLRDHYEPYHAELATFGDDVVLCVDCHTMAEVAPPIAPDVGERPLVCLGDYEGRSCPRSWTESLRECFAKWFDGDVTIGVPFGGGFITREHGQRSPWVQLELSRTDALSVDEKRERVLGALGEWCRGMRD